MGLPFFHLSQLMDLNPAVILFFLSHVAASFFLFCHLSLLLDLNLTIIADLDQTVTVFLHVTLVETIVILIIGAVYFVWHKRSLYHPRVLVLIRFLVTICVIT